MKNDVRSFKNTTHPNNIVHLCKVKVTGFTFIRNALIYDYPIREAIRSVLPLCDEFLVAVGQSDDKTLELIHDIGSPKIRIIETIVQQHAVCRVQRATCWHDQCVYQKIEGKPYS